jgi:glyoxylase-like metal-dependent hydrolase (beta-lactamase superfamily II)
MFRRGARRSVAGMNTNALHTHSPLAPAGRAVGADVRVHVLATGRLVGNRTFLRAEGWSGLIRRPEPVEFPVLSYAVEHPEGLIVIDTGLAPGVRVARSQRRFAPTPVPGSRAGIADRIRAAGLDPADVRRVVITHLDWDHAGNLDAFPRAEVLVHRPEWRYAATAFGRARYQGARMWPAAFTPTLYDLDAAPCGPFPASRALTDRGDAWLVPIPGHSVAQVGVLLRTDAATLFFSADHSLRQDWLLEDLDAGRHVQLGIWFRRQAVETTGRIDRLLRDEPTVLLPAHDDDAPARLAALETAPPPAG